MPWFVWLNPNLDVLFTGSTNILQPWSNCGALSYLFWLEFFSVFDSLWTFTFLHWVGPMLIAYGVTPLPTPTSKPFGLRFAIFGRGRRHMWFFFRNPFESKKNVRSIFDQPHPYFRTKLLCNCVSVPFFFFALRCTNVILLIVYQEKETHTFFSPGMLNSEHGGFIWSSISPPII